VVARTSRRQKAAVASMDDIRAVKWLFPCGIASQQITSTCWKECGGSLKLASESRTRN
jgi:hypothetical protein